MALKRFKKELEACNSMECWQRVLRDIALFYELDHFIYGAIIQLPGGENFPITIDGYPPGWWDHYQANDYLRHDPAVLQILKSSTPFTWDQLELTTPLQAQIMNEAARFGIRSGVSCPLHTPTGSASLSFASRYINHPNLTLFEHDFFYLAHALHASVVAVYQNTRELLSPRQAEVMKLCAHGLNRAQIAAALGISENTVRDHCRATYRKIGARNKTEALSRARALGLLPVL